MNGRGKTPNAERRTQNAERRMHCLLAVSFTCVCLRLAFICWKGQYFIVFGPFQQIKANRKQTQVKLIASKQCIRRSAFYPCRCMEGTSVYIGLTENDFMTRYRNHTASFRHVKHRTSTELSKHIWTLKDSNIGHSISALSWRIMTSSSVSYNNSPRSLSQRETFNHLST